MRVVFLSNYYLPQVGGIQCLVDNVARGLEQQWNHTVSIVSRPWPGRASLDCVGGIPVIRLAGLGGSPARLALELWRTRPVREADVLLCVEPRLRWSLPSALVTRALGIPLVLVLAGTYSEFASPLSRWIAGVGATKVIGISRYALRAYGRWPRRWHLVHAGVDIDESAPIANYREREDLVLTVARVNPRKNLQTVIRCAKLLPDEQFVIVGSTTGRQDYHSTLVSLVEELQVRNVKFVGEVSDTARDEFYRRARLFFLPSLHEMFGIVFAEAMAAGLPIIATDCTAIPEVVTPAAGVLLAPGAQPQAFADEIRRLLTDQRAWTALSRGAIERSREFTVAKTIRGYAEVIASVGHG